MYAMIRHLYKTLTGLWYRHQRELDERDERISDLELIISNQEHEINELRSLLDKYRCIFSHHQSVRKLHRNDNEHRRSGVSAPPSTLCTLIKWEKPKW